ncbi:hypothetical protein BHE74_00007306 [Ensete ventricosum]|nr:hypothetical protein BHE74_00007306 [Ensete ventricosum]
MEGFGRFRLSTVRVGGGGGGFLDDVLTQSPPVLGGPRGPWVSPAPLPVSGKLESVGRRTPLDPRAVLEAGPVRTAAISSVRNPSAALQRSAHPEGRPHFVGSGATSYGLSGMRQGALSTRRWCRCSSVLPCNPTTPATWTFSVGLAHKIVREKPNDSQFLLLSNIKLVDSQPNEQERFIVCTTVLLGILLDFMGRTTVY